MNAVRLALPAIVAATFAAAAAAAQSEPGPAGRWIPDRDTGCLVWVSRSVARTVSWSGRCIDGKAEGRGELLWFGTIPDRALLTYEGDMVAGRRHGCGVLTSPLGVRYEGAWRDGVQDGLGLLVGADGGRYAGGWRDGRQHGSGVYLDKEGRRWEGDWVDGKPVSLDLRPGPRPEAPPCASPTS